MDHPMARPSYNPEVAPNAQDWLALPELERIRLAQKYHVAARAKIPGMKLHAVLHTVVENQIATGYGPSERAVARLQSEGLSRHEAIHAIGSVVANFIYDLCHKRANELQASFQVQMDEAIEALHAKTWFSRGGDD